MKKHHAIIRTGGRSLAALAIAVGLLGAAQASPASAVTSFPDNDQVYNTVSGSSMSGTVTWTSYRSGTGYVTVNNDMTDGVCTIFTHRVKQNGAWGDWVEPVRVCTIPSYRYSVWTGVRNSNIQGWQFRLAEAGGGTPVYDTNVPLGS